MTFAYRTAMCWLWDCGCIYVWLFISSSNKMSLILFSAIILVLLSNVDSFSDTYMEKWHCCCVSTGGLRGSFNTWMQVDSSSSLFPSVDLFEGLVVLFLGVESDDADEAPENDASRFMLNSLSEGSGLGVWRLCNPSDRVSLLFPAWITGRRNCSFSQYIQFDL